MPDWIIFPGMTFFNKSPTDAANAVAEAAQMAVSAGLRYVSCDDPGIRRVRSGKAFYYLMPDNRRLRSARELKRIASMAIPPAYENVWICVNPHGHLQATGQDARGRKQYRYHPHWRQMRDSVKFDRMVAFGEALPRLRARINQDLARNGLPREKVLATVAALLDVTRARIGNTEYARDNRSFGLTTLRNRHVMFRGAALAVLKYRGKGGVQHEIPIDDKRIVRVVHRCHELPGQHLFQYFGEDGKRHPVDSGLVNDYLRETMGHDFTAKDFRTWGATLRALMLIARVPRDTAASEGQVRRTINGVIKEVASELRNTAAVCRKSYINPVVFDAWRSGAVHSALAGRLAGGSTHRVGTLVLQFLRRHSSKGVRPNRVRRQRPAAGDSVGGFNARATNSSARPAG